jgi:hypothetical protein
MAGDYAGLPSNNNEENRLKAEAIFDLVKRRYDFELQRTNDLDSKAGSLIGYVTIVTGLLIGLGTFDLLNKLSRPEYFIPYFSGITSLVFSMIASLVAVRVIKYNIEPKLYDLERFLDNIDNADWKYVTIIRQSIRPFIDAVTNTKTINNSKAFWITAGWISLVIGLILMISYSAIFVASNYKQGNGNNTETESIVQTISKVDKDVISKIYPSIITDDGVNTKLSSITLLT